MDMVSLRRGRRGNRGRRWGKGGEDLGFEEGRVREEKDGEDMEMEVAMEAWVGASLQRQQITEEEDEEEDEEDQEESEALNCSHFFLSLFTPSLLII